MTRIALISPDPLFRSLVTETFQDSSDSVEWSLRAETDVVDLGPANVDRLVELHPEVAFVDVGDAHAAGTRFISALSAAAPQITIVAGGGRLDAPELLQLMRAGASEYIARPLNREEIVDACLRLRRKKTPRASASRPVRKGQLITVFSAKGGTGVTTLAANLAVHLRTVTDRRTLLLDLAPVLGTCPVVLGTETRYSYLDVVESLSRMDEQLLNSFLEQHGSGLRLLGSPMERPSADVSRDSFGRLLRLLRTHFDYVVADLGRTSMDSIVATALEAADDRIILTTPDLPTLRNTKQVVSRMPEQKAGRLRLVVNRYEDGRGMSKKDVERAVGLTTFQLLAEDRDRVNRSVNLGRPIVLNGSCPFSRGIEKIGEEIAGSDVMDRKSASGILGLIRAVFPPYGGSNGRSPGATAGRNGRQRLRRTGTTSETGTRETE